MKRGSELINRPTDEPILPARGGGREKLVGAPRTNIWPDIVSPRAGGTRFMINRQTGEPILPARTANQYLARYWFAVSAGKIGSPVLRFMSDGPSA